MDKEQLRQDVMKLIQETEKLIPVDYIADLAPLDGFPEIPIWHQFEHSIWKNGEAIRQLLKHNKSLTKDKDISEKILSICLNRNAKRGRQTFIMLFWNKDSTQYADKLVNQLDDNFVAGHIIQGLNKMKVPYYVSQVKPFCIDKTNWIRKQANKYIEEYDK